MSIIRLARCAIFDKQKKLPLIRRTIVAAVLISKDNKILLGRQREGGVYPDCWHIPGGGVEAGETKEQALIREIQEEVGIDISHYPTTLLSDSDSGTAEKTDKATGEKFQAIMQFNTYRVEIPADANDIRLSLDDDLADCQWVDIAKLKNFKPLLC